MRIAVDAFGGDNAPLEILKGAADAVKEFGVEVVLTGDEQKIVTCAKENGIDLNGMEIVHTDEVFDMHDQPTEIVKSKKNTSLGVAMQLVADGKADAVVSAGSTGAVIVGATFIVKRIKGIKRPALGSVIPGKKRNFMLMDVGANAECRPEMLQQFAIMSSAYLEGVAGIKNPEIGLLNIGTEDTKGDELRLETYKLLKESPINFIGNVEAREIPAGVCDAVITDGFTGNITLKLYEGVATNMMKLIKEMFMSTVKTKIAALLSKKKMYGLKSMFDYSKIGGAPVLGVKKPVIKAHGSSNAEAIKNAINQAKVCVEMGIVDKITEGVVKLSTEEA